MGEHQKNAAEHSTFKIDDLARRILHELQVDGRLSCRELGRRCKCSTTTVIERIARMERAGVIAGYRARVDPKALGMPFKVIIRLSVANGQIEQLAALVASRAEISECYIAKGDAGSLFVKAHLISVERLEALIDLLLPYGMPYASLVLSSVVDGREIELPRREY
jgi:Lrp/AsnC family leucine-responsive transcriptional regulator